MKLYFFKNIIAVVKEKVKEEVLKILLEAFEANFAKDEKIKEEIASFIINWV